ncbi:type IV pilus twitching motility protein PilT, partial [bacterium]|nr:type IV pilus twitching motility protein PilT [bacterium]
MSELDKVLSFAINHRASDIHFSSGEPIRFRIDGDLVAINSQVLEAHSLEALLFELLTEEEQAKLYNQKNLDKCYSVPGIGQFRVNIFFNRKGIAAVLRSIPVEIPSFQSLGLPEVIQKLAEKPRGLVLVTGPTGSGKSTTLAAIIDHINSNFPSHILTVEDPVEFVHTCKKSLINQREIGHSCPSFQDALKYALREDPDVILIGELRDLETISLALTAAETGHLVFGTLHTRGAAASIDRIIDSFPAGQQAMIRTMLADSLLAVISQALLKRADGKGRVAVYEIMVVNNAISNLIREGKVFQMEGVIQTGKKDGMVLMEQSLISLISQGIVTPEEAAPYLKNPQPP